MLSPLRIVNAFKYTCQGLKSAWQTEAAFRDDVVLVTALQLSCIWLKPDMTLWLFLMTANILLLVVELLNTGIEYLANHISRDHHELLGRAKDVGSAAVFFILLMNGLVESLIAYRFFAD